MDFGSTVAARQTSYGQLHYGGHRAVFPGNDDSLFSVSSISYYSFIYPGWMEGWVGLRTEVCSACKLLLLISWSVDTVSCWTCSMTGNGRRTLPTTGRHRAALYEFHRRTASSFWRSNQLFTCYWIYKLYKVLSQIFRSLLSHNSFLEESQRWDLKTKNNRQSEAGFLILLFFVVRNQVDLRMWESICIKPSTLLPCACCLHQQLIMSVPNFKCLAEHVFVCVHVLFQFVHSLLYILLYYLLFNV